MNAVKQTLLNSISRSYRPEKSTILLNFSAVAVLDLVNLREVCETTELLLLQAYLSTLRNNMPFWRRPALVIICLNKVIALLMLLMHV